ncbi:beta strand repeat-containing protein [Ochrobactrum chromiisoli]|uniref:Autotransporter-associated beta strand repeat-containing protein n=1 Tax=Ochrobactrum chromiisoli TaxID=2993941 RepID=A0ABT3QRT9_9HYPH|nr:autotransporter-associated beta strand repeat-containing protein [Ochrobactrum chromiisoli]MCX2698334.1 autotransporter-associated beta strand repeat-containing protein [Ochrobactrum chromiisoli]
MSVPYIAYNRRSVAAPLLAQAPASGQIAIMPTRCLSQARSILSALSLTLALSVSSLAITTYEAKATDYTTQVSNQDLNPGDTVNTVTTSSTAGFPSYSVTAGTYTVNSATIEITLGLVNDVASAVLARGTGAHAIITGSIIRAHTGTGIQAQGLRADQGGTITVSGTTVAVDGESAVGLAVDGAGSTINVNSSTVINVASPGTDNWSYGVAAYGGARMLFDGGGKVAGTVLPTITLGVGSTTSKAAFGASGASTLEFRDIDFTRETLTLNGGWTADSADTNSIISFTHGTNADNQRVRAERGGKLVFTDTSSATGSTFLISDSGTALDFSESTLGTFSVGSLSGNNGFVTLGTNTFEVTGSSDDTYSGVIQGTGGFTYSGTGTFTLGGANTYTGGTVVNSGKLIVSANANLGAATGALGFNGGTLLLTDSFDNSRAVTLGMNGGTIQTTAEKTNSFSGKVTGAGSLTKTGDGTLVLSSTASDYTGGTQIDGGVVSVSANANLGAATGALGFDGGTLLLTDSFDNSRAVTLGTNGGTIQTTAEKTNSFSGKVTGAGSLTKTGDGTLVLSSTASDYTGGTQIDGGIVSVSADRNLGATTGALGFNGGTLLLTDSFDNSRAVTLGANGGTIQTTAAKTNSFSGKVTGAGSLTKTGDGTLVLSSTASDYTGGTQIDGGVVSVSADRNLGATTGALGFNGGTLLLTDSFDNSRAVTLGTNGGTIQTTAAKTNSFSGKVTGTGKLTKTGDGTLVLAGTASDYTGGTQINGGVVSVSADRNLGAATGALGFNGGTLLLTDSFDNSRAVTLGTNGGTIQTTAAKTNTFSGTVTGTGKLTKTGDGTLVLAGTASDYTGGTQIDGGVVSVSADRNLGATTGALGFNGGTLLLTDSFDNSRAVTLGTNGGTIQTTAAKTNTFSGTVTGTGKLTKTGDGTLVLAGTASDYTGGTQINGGVVSVSADRNLGAATGALGFNGGTLLLTDSFDNSRAVTLGTNGGTIQTTAAKTNTFSGTVTGTGKLTKTGDGTLVLSSTASDYTGGTQIDGGVLSVSANANLGAATGALGFNGGTLLLTDSFDNSRAVTLGTNGGTIQTTAAKTNSFSGTVNSPRRVPAHWF